MSLFDLLGAMLGLYVVLALVRGRVSAKAGWRLREIVRDEEPADFWTVIVLYGLLSLALIVWF
ncbi:MAG: hypothetical protein KF903_04295 [Dokdonella sp.]|uniref:hypothetical protein n=1 Tax=Dokdonella sp. TaxID=2291710 RepID=UPI0025BB8704|nr:hypothetical protein [Dokdonella sp.]MBX3700200.1 hypothetical protein [Dokdonella sp.]MCW5578747.1 hypothetical protein [Dokdonella sp.]